MKKIQIIIHISAYSRIWICTNGVAMLLIDEIIHENA